MHITDVRLKHRQNIMFCQKAETDPKEEKKHLRVIFYYTLLPMKQYKFWKPKKGQRGPYRSPLRGSEECSTAM